MDEAHANDPLHGLTLQAILERLLESYGWEGLAERIPIRCFSSDPSVKSSLVFLRRTPWARAKVEALYLGKLGARPRRSPKPRSPTGAAGGSEDRARRPGHGAAKPGRPAPAKGARPKPARSPLPRRDPPGPEPDKKQ